MAFKRMLAVGALAGTPFAVFCQILPIRPPVPTDPLELVTGPIQVAETANDRTAVFRLLSRARNSYALRDSGRSYDLKVHFTVNSGGQTQYDGDWQMEEVFDPNLGMRWTATAAAGYTTTRLAVNQRFYSEGTANAIPLRLQEARSVLFGPIATSKYVERDVIRTSAATINGVPVTCILLSGPRNPRSPAPGRLWTENEECIDPQSGLLQLHSLAPGLYETYDYANAPVLGNRKLPRRVTATEAGRTVMRLEVESLTEIPSADPSLFAPTEKMKAGGPGLAVAEARTIVMLGNPRSFRPDSTVRPVCVFGIIMPSGEFVEAHSLQPSDPNSQAAVQSAMRASFRSPSANGGRPEQRFGFVLEEFADTH